MHLKLTGANTPPLERKSAEPVDTSLTATDFATPPSFARRPSTPPADEADHRPLRLWTGTTPPAHPAQPPAISAAPLPALTAADAQWLRPLRRLAATPQPGERQTQALAKHICQLITRAGQEHPQARLAHLVALLGGDQMPAWAMRGILRGVMLGVERASPTPPPPHAAATALACAQALLLPSSGTPLPQSHVAQFLRAIPAGCGRVLLHQIANALVQRLGPLSPQGHREVILDFLVSEDADPLVVQPVMSACLHTAGNELGALSRAILDRLLETASRMDASRQVKKTYRSADHWLQNALSCYTVALKGEMNPMAPERQDALVAAHAAVLDRAWQNQQHSPLRSGTLASEWARALQAAVGYRPLSPAVDTALSTATMKHALRLAGAHSPDSGLSGPVYEPAQEDPVEALVELAMKLDRDPLRHRALGKLVQQVEAAAPGLLPTGLWSFYTAMDTIAGRVYDPRDPQSTDPDASRTQARPLLMESVIRVGSSLSNRQYAAVVRSAVFARQVEESMKVFSLQRDIQLDLGPGTWTGPHLGKAFYQAIEAALAKTPPLAIQPSRLAVLASELERSAAFCYRELGHSEPRDVGDHLSAVAELAPRLTSAQLLATVFGVISARHERKGRDDALDRFRAIKTYQPVINELLARHSETRDADGMPLRATFERGCALAGQPLWLLDPPAAGQRPTFDGEQAFDLLTLAFAPWSENMDSWSTTVSLRRLKDAPALPQEVCERLVIAMAQDRPVALSSRMFREVHAAVLSGFDRQQAEEAGAAAAPAREGKHAASLDPADDALPSVTVDVAQLMAFYDSLMLQVDLRIAMNWPADRKPGPDLSSRWQQGLELLQICLEDVEARYAVSNPALYEGIRSRLVHGHQQLEKALGIRRAPAQPSTPSLAARRVALTERLGVDRKHAPAGTASVFDTLERLPAKPSEAREALQAFDAQIQAIAALPEGRALLLESLALTAPRHSPVQLLLVVQAIAPALARALGPSTAGTQLYGALAGQDVSIEGASVVARELVRLLRPLPGGQNVALELTAAIRAAPGSAARTQALLAAVGEDR